MVAGGDDESAYERHRWAHQITGHDGRESAMLHLQPSDIRELDYRLSDGIEIRLLWSQSDDRLLVTVDDRRTGACFQIDVRDRDRTLEVFHHPYAYAAWHGVGTGGHEPTSAAA
jgi:hypothetical protein